MGLALDNLRTGTPADASASGGKTRETGETCSVLLDIPPSHCESLWRLGPKAATTASPEEAVEEMLSRTLLQWDCARMCDVPHLSVLRRWKVSAWRR